MEERDDEPCTPSDVTVDADGNVQFTVNVNVCPLPASDQDEATDHGALSGLADDDHPQYLLVDPSTRALVSDLDAGGQHIANLRPASSPGEAVAFEQAVKNGDEAGGDLAGTYPGPAVAGLQGRPVAETPPTLGQVLQWTGSAWTPVDVPTGRSNSPREESELARIVALNWPHGGSSSLRLVLDGESVSGLAIAFGEGRDGGAIQPARVRAAALTDRTVQVFTETFDSSALGGTGAWRRFRLPLDGPIGLDDVALGSDGLIAEAVSTTDPLVAGAFYPLDEALRAQIPEGALEVVMRGAFITDEEGRALDGEHVRGALPTGSRPSRVDVGVQGGRFESWLTLRPSAINVNTATVEELRALPRIGPSLAEAIVETREERGGFETVGALTTVPGIGRRLLSDLRDRMTT
jgi:competence ComEA-like helix-hairpin-helix protein